MPGKNNKQNKEDEAWMFLQHLAFSVINQDWTDTRPRGILYIFKKRKQRMNDVDWKSYQNTIKFDLSYKTQCEE